MVRDVSLGVNKSRTLSLILVVREVVIHILVAGFEPREVIHARVLFHVFVARRVAVKDLLHSVRAHLLAGLLLFLLQLGTALEGCLLVPVHNLGNQAGLARLEAALEARDAETWNEQFLLLLVAKWQSQLSEQARVEEAFFERAQILDTVHRDKLTSGDGQVHEALDVPFRIELRMPY